MGITDTPTESMAISLPFSLRKESGLKMGYDTFFSISVISIHEPYRSNNYSTTAHLLAVVLDICQVVLQVTVQVLQIDDDTRITSLEVFWDVCPKRLPFLCLCVHFS
jgi:hypothetical protein